MKANSASLFLKIALAEQAVKPSLMSFFFFYLLLHIMHGDADACAVAFTPEMIYRCDCGTMV